MNIQMSKTTLAEIAMLAVVVVAAAVSAIRPHSFAVWMTEIFWVAGLLAVLLSTRRMFRFSLAAFLGSQGDVWDAQKDILCDTLGALCASTLFLFRERRFT